MSDMRKLLVHLNDDVVSRQAIEWAGALADSLGAHVSGAWLFAHQRDGVLEAAGPRR